ncbi:GD17104 [Drosophila simulans]|uniref:Lipid scramblase CLPTM1L n=1 Tax=Drosophila simulans TaxID=7240 RepID=B4R424_DROSI|nr:GD17104 [Drosophila simulans]
MALPSISTLLGVAFLAYIGHSIYQMSQLFTTLQCSGVPCYTSFLADRPRLQLALFSSLSRSPIATEVRDLYKAKRFDYDQNFQHDFEVDVPLRTRRNGSLHLHVVLALEGEPLEWRSLRRDGPTVVHTMSLTDYMVPRAEAFQLLGDSEKGAEGDVQEKEKKKSSTTGRPSTHIRSNIYTDTFNTRLKDLVPVTRNPLQARGRGQAPANAAHGTRHPGAAHHWICHQGNDLKGIFSDTNVYLLCGTIFMSSIHVVMFFGLPVAPVVIMLKILSPSRKKRLA